MGIIYYVNYKKKVLAVRKVPKSKESIYYSVKLNIKESLDLSNIIINLS